MENIILRILHIIIHEYYTVAAFLQFPNKHVFRYLLRNTHLFSHIERTLISLINRI